MINIQDIYEARETIKDSVHKTPLLQSTQLNKLTGNNVFIKGEHLQKTGSFKFRGATNRIKQAVKNGETFVTTASSGNHGQAIAYATNEANIRSTIFVPENVPKSKEGAIKAYNGNLVKFGTLSRQRIQKAIEYAQAENGIFIPPFDDTYVIAGQGTIGLELLEQLDAIDVICVPIGGGGLISGIATAIKELKPSVQIIGVEPELSNVMYQSFQKGEIQALKEPTGIADGLRTSNPGEITFSIISKYVDDIVLVSEQEIKEALSFVMERMKQVIEPSGVASTAAVLFDKLNVRNKNIVCIASGGNIDIHQISHILGE